MRPRSLVLIALLAAALVVALFLSPLVRKAPSNSTTPNASIVAAPPPHTPPPLPSPPASSEPLSAPASDSGDSPPPAPPPPPRARGPLRIPVGHPIPELLPHQTERDAILAHASTYDVARIPLIAPYLSHANPTVRETARLGLLQLGDAAAVPHLRSALAVATDADERAALQEAIDFLALPPSHVTTP